MQPNSSKTYKLYMKKYLLVIMLLVCQVGLTGGGVFAQSMSDTQVMQFIQREAKAGTSQQQIVTKLMQRGVNIDQIRRVRKQYTSQIESAGKTQVVDRMEGNGDQTTKQELVTAKVNTSSEVYSNAAEEVQDVENEVQATQNVAPDADGKRVFGRDIFRQANPNFQPNINTPIPPTYVLGPGDQVVVDIYGASQHTLTHVISPEGTITVSGYGPIYLSGLTVEGAQSKLRKTLGSRYQSSSLRLTVGNTRTIQVNVMGEVRSPGAYYLSAFANVFYAIYRAGGTSTLGTLRNIQVYRNGHLVTVVDLYDYILNGRLAGNILLHDNDVIVVPPYESLVGVTGNVKRPMFYEMRKDESVATLLKYAGGFTGDAHKKSVRLVRQTGERYQVYNVNEFDMASFKVEDGDAVTVDGMINRYENMVEVKGAVFRPGLFQLGINVNSVKTLIEAAEGLTEDAFTSHAVLHRLKADRSLEILPLNIQGIMDGTVADVPLQNEDVLFIMTQEDLRQERTLTITGMVMSPGTYEYADNVTIEDLIVMAGGLRDQASLEKIDVSRRILDPHATKKNREISKTFSFAIKEGLVIEQGRQFVLEPYDVVHVRRSPAFSSARNISVSGEVNYEGSFTMVSKDMRLSDAILMAGGVTEQAYVRGARLERVMTEDERARMLAAIKLAKQTATGKDSVQLEQLETSTTFPVGIHLDEALAKPGSDADITLREGDRLVVPEYNGTVKISGNVLYPITVAYQPGKSYKYYIDQAGGFGQRAKKSKTYIVYQNGTGNRAKKGKVEPGCELIVPTKPEPNTQNLMQWLSIGTSFASLATMFVAIANLFK